MKTSLALLPAVIAGLFAVTAPVHAQSLWSDTPAAAESAQRSPEEEAARAERRKKYAPVAYPKFMQGGDRPAIAPAEPPIVYFDQKEDPGSIIVDTQARKLYYVLPGKKAYQYPISVGRDGFTWSGTERISRVAEWPSWTPPAEMHKRVPGLPITVTGGLKNPQGARALYLGNTIYRIHGTNNDRTVGRANSSGCFRLTNEHVIHLAGIARVGTKVKVLQAYNGGVSENAPMASLFSWGDDEPATPKAKTKPKPRKPLAKKPKPVTTASVTPAAAAAPMPANDAATPQATAPVAEGKAAD